MKRLKPITALVVCLALLGCVTNGLSPRTASVDYSRFVYDIADAEQTDAAQTEDASRPTPQPPIRLAVAQLGENAPPEALISGLSSAPELIERVVALPLPPLDRPAPPGAERSAERARRLRQLAGQLGADYVFVVGGNIDSRTESNGAEILDILLVPMVVVPSHRVLVHGKAVGTLLTVAEGYPVSMLTVESRDSGYAPTAHVDQQHQALASAQRDALSRQMAERLLGELRKLQAPAS